MKNKITFLPSWSKIKRLFLAFPTMENRMNCIDEFLQLLYVIASTYNKKTLKITIVCDKGKVDYIKKLILEYKNLKTYFTNKLNSIKAEEKRKLEEKNRINKPSTSTAITTSTANKTNNKTNNKTTTTTATTKNNNKNN